MSEHKILSIDIDYCLSHKDFEEVFELFCSNLSKIPENKILLSNHHIDILDLIGDIHDPMTIYNIDFHHDIFYDNDRNPAELRNSIADSSNWLGWLFIHRMVKQYVWIKQDMSEQFDSDSLSCMSLMYDKSLSYDIIDSRNILFNSKKAVLEKTTDAYLKCRPAVEVENRIKKYLYDIEFDYLFVCLSPDYTPKEHFFMYDLLQTATHHFSKKP